MSEPLLLGAKEVSQMLGIGRTLFYELNQSGRLGPMPHKLGRRRLWNKQELEQWVSAGMPSRGKWQTIKEQAGDLR